MCRSSSDATTATENQVNIFSFTLFFSLLYFDIFCVCSVFSVVFSFYLLLLLLPLLLLLLLFVCLPFFINTKLSIERTSTNIQKLLLLLLSSFCCCCNRATHELQQTVAFTVTFYSTFLWPQPAWLAGGQELLLPPPLSLPTPPPRRFALIQI